MKVSKSKFLNSDKYLDMIDDDDGYGGYCGYDGMMDFDDGWWWSMMMMDDDDRWWWWIWWIWGILYIYLSVCFVSNKRLNGWTNRAQILYGTSRDPREGLLTRKISKICLPTKFDLHKILKIYDKEKIFTIEKKSWVHI